MSEVYNQRRDLSCIAQERQLTWRGMAWDGMRASTFHAITFTPSTRRCIPRHLNVIKMDPAHGWTCRKASTFVKGFQGYPGNPESFAHGGEHSKEKNTEQRKK
jgi:hypothetical protein